MGATEENKIPPVLVSVILVLLIAITVLGVLTAKKHLVREPTINPIQSDINTFTEMVNTYPNDPEIRANLAYAHQRAENLAEAKTQYLKVLELVPDHLAANYNLGVIAKKDNNLDEAKKYFDKVLSEKPDHVLGTIGLGEVYLAKKEYDRAIEVVDSLISSQKTITNLRLIKARALEAKGDKAAAKTEYEAVLKFIPTHEEAKTALERLK